LSRNDTDGTGRRYLLVDLLVRSVGT
jgi:hypothetical protein